MGTEPKGDDVPYERRSGMTRLRVGLVSTAPVDVPGSMRAYADVLMKAFAQHAPDVEARMFELAPVALAGSLAQRVQMLSLPLKARRQRHAALDVWHVLDGSRAYLASALKRAPVVITAHDIIPRLQRQGRFPGSPAVGRAAGWLWQRNGAAMRHAQAVVCVSDRTRLDILTQFGEMPDTRVVHLPVRPGLAPVAGNDKDEPREPGLVLHVGNNSFYKHRPQVLRIFARMDRELRRSLVMLGSPPTPELLQLADMLGIAAEIRWIDGVDDTALAGWYRRASVLLFPSLYEGFGWPVLEAMSFGLPVVCSNAGSLPEVVGPAATCFTPDNVDGFALEADVLLREPAYARSRGAQGLMRSMQFSLESFARGTCDAYAAAMASWRIARP